MSQQCDACQREMPSHEEGVHLGAQVEQTLYWCIPCFNQEVAEGAGIDFQTPTFKPVTLKDVQGQSHVFHFLTRLCPNGVIIEAYEVIDDQRQGYEFFYLCENPMVESLHLLQTVLARANRMLAKQHIESSRWGYRLTRDKVVRGRIVSQPLDSPCGGLPNVIIDGQELTWNDVGQLLAAEGGHQLKLEIKDPVDDND